MQPARPKIAYLILGHRCATQLAQLVDALRGSATTIAIHIDRKAEGGAFERALRGRPVTFLPERFSVWHTGYRMVEATLALMRLASAVEHDYYVLLSGDDYPIRSDEEILRFFSGTRLGFIGHYELLPGRHEFEQLARKRYPDIALFNRRWSARHGLPKPLVKFVERLVLAPVRKPTLSVQVYRGSQWWALPHDMVRYLIGHADDPANREFRRFFRLTALSDEMYFQTALLNSPHREDCHGYGRTRDSYEFISALHYIDWSPGREAPAHLTLQDLEPLRRSGNLFARKLVDPKSAELRRALDSLRAAREKAGSATHPARETSTSDCSTSSSS